MIILQIDKVKLRIPSQFKELRLSTGVEVMEYFKDKTITYNDKIAILSTLSGVEPESFLKMTKKTVEQSFDNLYFFKSDVQQMIFYPSFKLNGKFYGLLDYDNMTVHEYADLEFYLSQSEYPLANLDKIMAILYRPIIHKKHGIKNILRNAILSIFFNRTIPKVYKSYKIEEYNDKHVKNSELFGREMDMGFAIASYHNMINERQKISNEFPTVFKPEPTDEDKDQYDETPPEKKFNSIGTIWGMYHYICELSGSLMEREIWYKKPIREFFTYLSYYNMKTELENQRLRTQQMTL